MDLAAKYEQRVLRLVPDGCWTIPSIKRNNQGYLRIRDRQAHRVFYEATRGSIPSGLTLDHLCRNRACINPDHLEPVTNRENVLRGEGHTAQRARQTHCRHGHSLSGANLEIRPSGHRRCVACAIRRTAEWRARNSQETQDAQRRYWASGRGAQKQRERRARLRATAKEEGK